jgi:competence ComEA-like helix-hairpin-helix protein
LPGALPGAEPARKQKAAGSSGEPERASSAELQRVSGIGPSTADKILQLRKSYGGYKSVDELLAIKGIGRERLDKMHKYRTVGKIPPTKAASTKPVTPPKSLPKRRRGKSHTASLDRAPVAHPFHGEGGPIGGGNHGMGARERICGGADGKPQALRPGLQMKGPMKCLSVTHSFGE